MSNLTKSSKQQIDLKFKFMWAIAAFGTAIISNSYAGLYVYFYQDYLGLKETYITIAATAYAIVNAFNDPIFGYISDKSRSHRGRRIPFMRYTAPFLAITFISVFLVPTEGAQTVQFWWYLISTILYDTAYTIIGLVYSALLPEISESNAERGSLSTFSSIFSLLGMIIGFLIPDLLKPENHGFTVFYMGIIAIGVIGAVCIIITTLYVKERPEFTQIDEPLPLWDSIKYTIVNKSFLILAFANFMSILMQSLILGSIFYLADYVLEVSGILVLLFVIGGLIIGVLTVNQFAKRFGVVQTQQALLVFAGIFLSLVVIVPDPLIYACLFIGGIGLSGPLVLTNVMFSQVADEDEVNSGVRREASFFGINALITKPAQSLAAIIVVWVLKATEFVTRVDGVAQPQPDSALFGIKIFIGLIPGIALILGALILFAFPLRGEYLEEINSKVLLMHDEKFAHWEQYKGKNDTDEMPK